MKVALTGATGFIGGYIVESLVKNGHSLKCWFREHSDLSPLDSVGDSIEWCKGELGEFESVDALVSDCDAVVHNALWRPGDGFRGAEGDIVEFSRVNVLGTLNLIERSIANGAKKFIFVSTCAVHEKILDDRPLDEAHPLWPLTHYGAHKAAIEKFVHSYGFGFGFPICAIRPTGVYGLKNQVQTSKWYALVERVVSNKLVRTKGGGKEVHASDVAKAINLLLTCDQEIAGEAYACYDRYISEYEVASIARELSGSRSEIVGEPKVPKHQITVDKLQELGMRFGGNELLRLTIQQLVDAAQQ